MGFTYDFSNGKTEVVYTPEQECNLNEEMQKIINHCKYLLNIRIRPGQEFSYSYDIKGKTNYLAWQSEATAEECQRMENRITDALEACSRQGIASECIVKEKRYMYVDDEKNIINFICIPSAMKITGEKNADISVSDTYKGKKMYEELKTPSLPDEIPEPPSDEVYETFSSNVATEDRQTPIKEELQPISFEEENNKENKPLYEEIGAVTAEEMEKYPLDEEDEPEDGTILLSDLEEDEDDDEKTVLLIPRPNGKAYIENMVTKERFYIIKNSTKIGKKKETVDILVKDNPTVSREHCVITYKMGSYYISDCNSLNYTYVDDHKLLKEESCQLTDNCMIKLSNEEFVFRTGEE